TAIAALRHPRLRVAGVDDHATAIRLLVDRHHDLGRLRTQSVCRLHRLLCTLTPGGHPRRMSADQAERMLATIPAATAVEATRKQMALELLGDVRRLDDEIALSKRRVVAAVDEADTTSPSSTASAPSSPGSSSATLVMCAGSRL